MAVQYASGAKNDFSLKIEEQGSEDAEGVF